MIDSAVEAISRIVADLSPLAYVAVFLGGVLTSLGPCNLSMVPVIIGYVGGQHEVTRRRGFWLATFFTLGSSLTFVLLGLVAAKLGALFGTQKAVLYWFVAVVCLLIGLSLLGVLHVSFDFLARLRPTRVVKTGLLGALLLGLVVGLAGSQCATPILAAILSLVLLKGKPVEGAALLFVYGLGRGLPIILVGTFTGVVKALPSLQRWTFWMERAAGLVLIAIGLYFLWIA